MYSTFPSFCRQPPDAPQRSLSHATPQLVGRPPITRGSGLRHSLAGSPTRPAESRSLSYGPMVHLRLLSTPPRGDAVTLSYRPESAGLEGTCTPLIEYTLRRTGADALVGHFARPVPLVAGPPVPDAQTDPRRSRRRAHCAQEASTTREKELHPLLQPPLIAPGVRLIRPRGTEGINPSARQDRGTEGINPSARQDVRTEVARVCGATALRRFSLDTTGGGAAGQRPQRLALAVASRVPASQV